MFEQDDISTPDKKAFRNHWKIKLSLVHSPIIVKVFPDPVWPLMKKKSQIKFYSGSEFFNNLFKIIICLRTHSLKQTKKILNGR